jgi:beta-carotene 15,15'-dioxygenase
MNTISMRVIIVLMGLFILCLSSLVVLSLQTQLYAFGLIIVLTGIPHGAMDFHLERQSVSNQSQTFSFGRFCVFYFLNMILYSLVWYLFRTPALILFIFFAAYHFGQLDTFILKSSGLSKIVSVFIGLFTILFIIVCHLEETAKIILYLVPIPFTEIELLSYKDVFLYFSVILLLFTILSYVVIQKEDRKNAAILLAQTFCLLTLVYLLPFYLGFAFYFGIWHSFLSFDLIRKHLKVQNNLEGWKDICIKILPNSLIAFASIGLLIWVLNSFELHQIIGGLFVGISIITLPHLQVFSKAMVHTQSEVNA